MRRFSYFKILVVLSCIVLLAGCSQNTSSVHFVGATGKKVALRALSAEAKTGVLEGASSTAWFSFNPSKAGIPDSAKERGGRGGLEIVVLNEGSSPVRISAGFVTRHDFAPGGILRKPASNRPLSVVSSVSRELRIRMLFPDSGDFRDVRGFALSLSGKADSRVRIVSVSVERSETGWERSSGSFWAGFEPTGGEIDCEHPSSVLARIVPNSVLALTFAGSGDKEGTPLKQNRNIFRAGSWQFGFRKTPVTGKTFVPSVLVRTTPSDVTPVTDSCSLNGLRVIRNTPFALLSGTSASVKHKSGMDVLVPILADPNMIIEWPQSAWRRSDIEVFAWDRFPSVIIFDTADYAVQDRFFNRLAFYVEKKGFRGRLLSDSEMPLFHGYNAHDYRADSLASFFEAVRKANFTLNADEVELRDILVAEGVIRKEGGSWVAGAGAVISVSRESMGYLRYLFMAHEGFHGIYFIDPDFRAKVSEVYHSMDPRAIKFLQTYFTVVTSLGYDTSDPYLMENEFMAYLMQQPEDRVAGYFTGNIADRYIRYGGDPVLERYISSTNASEFVRAAHELNEYAFTRWGLAGGRIGLYFFD